MTTTLQLECGCEVEVDHVHGDRHVTCACGLEWVARALRVDRVTYRVDPARPSGDVRG